MQRETAVGTVVNKNMDIFRSRCSYFWLFNIGYEKLLQAPVLPQGLPTRGTWAWLGFFIGNHQIELL